MAPFPLPYDGQNALASTIASDNTHNIRGKIVLATGVSQGGLGATFVECIAAHKPQLLILAGRSPSKVQITADKITLDPKNAGVEVRILELDLASQSQIRHAAAEVLAYSEGRIDVLVNSAGIMTGPYTRAADDLENNFGSNHIRHFLFTNLIMPSLLAAPSPRVVSDGAVYDQWAAYGQSKTASILFSRSLAAKLESRGLKSYSLHPGVTFGTSLAPDFKEEDFVSLKEKDKVIGWDRDFDLKTLDECAATHVVAAFDTRLEAYNGVYLEDGNLSDDVQPTARGEGIEERLWELSEQLVGEKFSY